MAGPGFWLPLHCPTPASALTLGPASSNQPQGPQALGCPLLFAELLPHHPCTGETTVPGHGLHFQRGRFKAEFHPPCPTADPVWNKEGLKIKHCKYPCFLQMEPAPESPPPPRQLGPDGSLTGVGAKGGHARVCPSSRYM